MGSLHGGGREEVWGSRESCSMEGPREGSLAVPNKRRVVTDRDMVCI